jgi:hypothetical protein
MFRRVRASRTSGILHKQRSFHKPPHYLAISRYWRSAFVGAGAMGEAARFDLALGLVGPNVLGFARQGLRQMPALRRRDGIMARAAQKFSVISGQPARLVDLHGVHRFVMDL